MGTCTFGLMCLMCFVYLCIFFACVVSLRHVLFLFYSFGFGRWKIREREREKERDDGWLNIIPSLKSEKYELVSLFCFLRTAESLRTFY